MAKIQLSMDSTAAEKKNSGSANAHNKQNPLRKLNIVFGIIIFLLFAANIYAVHDYNTTGRNLGDTLVNAAGSSLNLAGDLLTPGIENTDGYTGLLIMGIDSRDLKFDGIKFSGKDRDIDTIIQVVVNNTTGAVFMFSIPRDTGVTVVEPCARQDRQYYKSINHIYKLAEDGKCPTGGVDFMLRYVTSITGFNNHYYAVISYEGFKDIINAVGETKDGKKGLYIDVPRNIREYYPREKGSGFESVYFSKGYQFIDTDRLLKYARSRQTTSDFDRARRQQQVLDALKQRLMNSDLRSDPFKILELYQSFQKNALFSPISIDDIRAGLSLANKFIEAEKTDSIYQVILDDTLGGLNKLITRPRTSGGLHLRAGYYLSPVQFNSKECKDRKDEYCKVKDYLKELYNAPANQPEAASVFVYSNVVGTKPASAALTTALEKYKGGATISENAIAMRSGWGDIQIYDFSGGKAPKSAMALEVAFGVTLIASNTAPFTAAPNNEDFVIIVKMNN